jgi:pilus assembly protein Flp/PilA
MKTMQTLLCRVCRFLDDEDGPTAVEYAIMLALILVACMNIVTTLGRTTSGTFSKVNSTLS